VAASGAASVGWRRQTGGRRSRGSASARGRFPAAQNTTVSCRTVCSSSSTVWTAR